MSKRNNWVTRTLSEKKAVKALNALPSVEVRQLVNTSVNNHEALWFSGCLPLALREKIKPGNSKDKTSVLWLLERNIHIIDKFLLCW